MCIEPQFQMLPDRLKLGSVAHDISSNNGLGFVAKTLVKCAYCLWRWKEYIYDGICLLPHNCKWDIVESEDSLLSVLKARRSRKHGRMHCLT